jgi:hypothetical protein
VVVWAACRMASLLQKPEKKKGTPTSAIMPMAKVAKVSFIFVEQAAELADVLLVVRGVDDRAGAEEEQGLEEGVRQQVEDRGVGRADADREHHVAELGDGGEGEDALDVVLGDGDERAEQRGDRADEGHDHACRASEGEVGRSG